jgi:hypothetical protein
MLIQPKRRAWKGGKIVHNNHTKTASAYRLMSDEELAEMADRESGLLRIDIKIQKSCARQSKKLFSCRCRYG